MGSYFKPLRRKIGVVTLALALVFAVAWVRSLTKYDFINSNCGGECCRFASRFGYLSFIRDARRRGTLVWDSGDLSTTHNWVNPDGTLNAWDGFDVEWEWKWGGFQFGSGIKKRTIERLQMCTVPYWSLVIPLTLLSAWLLLGEPRVAKTARDQPIIPRGQDSIPVGKTFPVGKARCPCGERVLIRKPDCG